MPAYRAWQDCAANLQGRAGIFAGKNQVGDAVSVYPYFPEGEANAALPWLSWTASGNTEEVTMPTNFIDFASALIYGDFGMLTLGLAPVGTVDHRPRSFDQMVTLPQVPSAVSNFENPLPLDAAVLWSLADLGSSSASAPLGRDQSILSAAAPGCRVHCHLDRRPATGSGTP